MDTKISTRRKHIIVLFWIRLRHLSHDKQQHSVFYRAFSWQGCQKEVETNLNVRKILSKNTVNVLNRLQRDSECCFFGGDLNESFGSAQRILESASFSEDSLKFETSCERLILIAPRFLMRTKILTLLWIGYSHGLELKR